MKTNRVVSQPGNAASAPYSPKRDVGMRSANDEDDPYLSRSKPGAPTVCPTCHAFFNEGRWTWQKAPKDAVELVCPACQRIHDRFPAGYITIKGEFFKEHKDEIIALMENHEKKEKAARPLQRIMGMDQKRDGFEVQTTDSHLARGLAEALHDAYKGDLKVRYSRDENLVRAVWKRER
jgi:NMD protein affecting ribosome stability and mRNA decay